AVLVAGGKQHGEHVVAVGLVTAALADQLEDQLVGLRLEVDELREGADAREYRRGERAFLRWREADRLVSELEHRAETLAERVEPRSGIETEDRAQDDLERERLHPRVQLEAGVARPARHLTLGR